MTLSAVAAAAIAAALEEAGHGERTATVRRLAELYGVSPRTIYRVASLGGRRSPGVGRRDDYRIWTGAVVALAGRAPDPKKRVPLDVALEAAVEVGAVPPEAAAMPVATLRRLAREMGLNERTKRTQRLHADYPMQALQIDGSSSEYLVVADVRDDGDHLLKLHRRPYSASGYKNKPLGPERLRVLLYAVWDMCTGYTLARYVVAKGETALDQLDFFLWVCGAKDDPRIVMHGVPDDLWSDLGAFAKHRATGDLLERLGVHLATGAPYAKERMGGVERTHRTRWERFERALFMRDPDTIRLSELNARLREYDIRENDMRASRTPVPGLADANRRAAWVALTNARPADNPLRELPDNPMATVAHADPRWIDGNGIVRWRGGQYECAGGWHDRWVQVRQAIDGSGELVLEDESTRERRVATRYVPRPYGEIRAAPKTPLERLRDTAPEVSGADLYAPADAPPAVVPMPARAAPAAPLDNPLDAGRYASLDEAMRALQAVCLYPLRGALRADAVAQIEAAGLDKEYVRELGLALVDQYTEGSS